MEMNNELTYAVGKQLVPIFAVCNPMWEILKNGNRWAIIAGNQDMTQKVVDALNQGKESNHE